MLKFFQTPAIFTNGIIPKVCEMEPVCEMAPGTVLSRFRISDHMYQAISKSGGFGSEDLLVQLADTILDKKERALC